MDSALDARTWVTIVGVIVGFFLVPFAMLVYDQRKQLKPTRQRMEGVDSQAAGGGETAATAASEAHSPDRLPPMRATAIKPGHDDHRRSPPPADGVSYPRDRISPTFGTLRRPKQLPRPTDINLPGGQL